MRRNILFSIYIVFFISTLSYGQDQLRSGVFNIGGSLSYTSTKSTFPTSYIFGYTKTELSQVTPSFSIFLIDRFQIGISWSYLYFSSQLYDLTNNFAGGGVIQKHITYGINTRYYYPIENQAVFIGFGYSYIVNLDVHHGYSYNGEIGFDIFVTRSIGVELSVQYLKTPFEGSLDSTLSLSLGLRYFFL